MPSCVWTMSVLRTRKDAFSVFRVSSTFFLGTLPKLHFSNSVVRISLMHLWYIAGWYCLNWRISSHLNRFNFRTFSLEIVPSNVYLKPLCLIQSLSLKTCKFPHIWNTVRLYLILKAVDAADVCNYKRIAVLFNFDKVFEYIL